MILGFGLNKDVGQLGSLNAPTFLQGMQGILPQSRGIDLIATPGAEDSMSIGLFDPEAEPEVVTEVEDAAEGQSAKAADAGTEESGAVENGEEVEGEEGAAANKDANKADDAKKADEDPKAEDKEPTLEEQQASLEEEVDALNSDIEAKQKEMEEKQKELEEKQKEQERLQAELEQAKAEGNEEKIAELQGQLDDIGAEIEALNGEIQSLQSDISGKQTDLQAKQNELQAVNNKIEEKKAAEQAAAQQAAAQQAAAQDANNSAPAQESAQPVNDAGNNGGSGNAGGANEAGNAGGSGDAGNVNSNGGANDTSSSGKTNATSTRYDFSNVSDKDMAAYIDNFLAEKGSPAAGTGAGEMMVKYGKENNVDPLVLLAIAGQETQWGQTGIGVNGMLGVGAYDSNPNNATTNPTFAGVENQIRVGAKTFANLREKGGASASDDMATQTAAVNSAGWASDQNWHNGVDKLYNQITADAAAKLGAPAIQPQGVSDMLSAMGSMEGLSEHNASDAARINAITGESGINCQTTPWCAAYAMNMLNDYGVLDTSSCSNVNYCPTIRNWAKENNIWEGAQSGYVPNAGDAVLFDWEGDGTADHIGVVEKVENGKVYTIEGNTSDAVHRREYDLNSGNLLGYVNCGAQTHNA